MTTCGVHPNFNGFFQSASRARNTVVIFVWFVLTGVPWRLIRVSSEENLKWQFGCIFNWKLSFCVWNWQTIIRTRMHSSSVRTVRFSDCHGKGGVCPGAGVSAWGYIPGGGLPRVRGVSAWGCLFRWGGRCLPRGVCLGGVSTRGGGWEKCTPLSGQNSWHMLVKSLPFRNYCCGW